MDKYGWYTDGDEILGGTGDDVAELVNEAIAEFAAGEALIAKNHGHSDEEVRQNVSDFIRKMRVGEMMTIEVDRLINEQDINEYGCEDSPPMGETDLWELIDVRVSDLVADGHSDIMKSSDPFPAEDKAGQIDAAAVLAWARKNIVFDPPQYCYGRNPLPMCLVNGQWIWGDKQHEDADVSAYVVYTTEPSPETGHMGWVWWVLGRMGDANTLQDAMAQAEAKLAQITAAEQAYGR